LKEIGLVCSEGGPGKVTESLRGAEYAREIIEQTKQQQEVQKTRQDVREDFEVFPEA
jgi:hypothetical protein